MKPLNREPEKKLFEDMLDGRDPAHLFVVYAEGKWGKTWLLDILKDVCQTRRILMAWADCRDRGLDYRGIVETVQRALKACADLEPSHALAMTLIQTHMLAVQGDFAERDIIKAQTVYLQYGEPPPGEWERRERERRVTTAFLDCLSAVSKSVGRVAVLVDTIDHLDMNTLRWLKEQWLATVRDDPRLRHVYVAVMGNPGKAGERGVTLPRFDGWGLAIHFQDSLAPFNDQHAVQLAKEIGARKSFEEICGLRRALNGNPGLLAFALDNWAREG